MSEIRHAYVDLSRRLIEREDPDFGVLRRAVSDALDAAGIDAGERFFVRVSVFELGEGSERFPTDEAQAIYGLGASRTMEECGET